MNTTKTHTIPQTHDDFKTAVVIVSVVANVFVLTAWLVAQTSAEYASQLASII